MASIRKKVLIISYLWPPMEGVGLIRASKFAKYLPEYGWEPIVLTVKTAAETDPAGRILADGVKVFRSDYADVVDNLKKAAGGIRPGKKNGISGGLGQGGDERKMRGSSLIREMVTIPDEKIGWYRFALEEGKAIIEKENVDAILSTSPPETTHLIARALKSKYGIPWIADLRDLWAEDHFRQRPFIKTALLRIMERRVLAAADAVITVSEPWANVLAKSLGTRGGRVHVIENGFDEEDFEGLMHGGNKKLTITYMGKLHKDHQPVESFFWSLAHLVETRAIDPQKLDVRFYVLGYDKPDITALARHYGLDGTVKEFPKVPYHEALKILRSSDILLFIQWRGRGEEGWYSAKLYDYIGARRPILAFSSKDGIIDRLIKRCSCGIVVDGMEEAEGALRTTYNEYISAGHVNYYGDDRQIGRLSRSMRTKDLAAILDQLTENVSICSR